VNGIDVKGTVRTFGVRTVTHGETIITVRAFSNWLSGLFFVRCARSRLSSGHDFAEVNGHCYGGGFHGRRGASVMLRQVTRVSGDLQVARGGSARPLVVAVAMLATCAASGTAFADAPTEDATKQRAAQHTAAGTLDRRVEVFSKALELDARQQAELRMILLHQREAVRKIWSDGTLLPAERAPATRAVADRTADQIRAILSDEQKKRYNPPKPPASGSGPPDVSAWMEAKRPK
jgi:hypothetical protein